MAYFEVSFIAPNNYPSVTGGYQGFHLLVSDSNNPAEWTVQGLNDLLITIGITDFTFVEATITVVDASYSIFYAKTSSFADDFDLNSLTDEYPVFWGTNEGISAFQFIVPTPTDLTLCDECRDVTLQACVDTYKIVAGLTAATEYYVAIEDRNGDIYTQAITSDSSGDLTIDATAPEFPVGFWLSESGNKVVKVYADEDLTELQDITVGTTVYTCVQLNLQYRYTTTTSITPDFNYMVDDTFNFYIDNSTNSYILS